MAFSRNNRGIVYRAVQILGSGHPIVKAMLMVLFQDRERFISTLQETTAELLQVAQHCAPKAKEYDEQCQHYETMAGMLRLMPGDERVGTEVQADQRDIEALRDEINTLKQRAEGLKEKVEHMAAANLDTHEARLQEGIGGLDIE
jgi:predicted RNase H-like nuclease (RuvC/YqgF family)